ncbi:MAG: LLM class flavin-dependent oxidoreductase [Pseudomonadales bacterium]|nr:LLM class flavin-dependent oxidoreductase [Pseudomonadales bacterium]MDP6472153.1 LLM class flavin-dependent oxidoreductase [Pseudomonadales bacterium]MDP6826595.1 LLM class flavin-dependent oxidoreductase [Pseudomonadales bacterium]MDP6970134.1 LLM class flavin-dependent oxidoreductase [Pseudomonadales bacterium]|tara:strand:+ start:3150 stop:4079 length:930 start_codon:yes stop_codon:yes gene_type:complete
MDFGVQVNVYRTSWDAVRSSVEAMDAGSWDSVWFADHFIPPGATREQEALTAFEGLSAIAFAGGMTKNLRLGNLVLGNTYRNPALVAKIAGTIDTASEGRFTLAIGAGWYQREHEAYGWTFPSMKERQDRFEEAVQLIRALVHSREPVDFDGEYYRLSGALLSPGAYGDSIPIMVGGTGAKRTLRTLARYGDIMNLDGWAGGGMALEYYLAKAEILERHCEDAGRDPAEIRRTLLMPCYLTQDKELIERAVRNLGPGTVAGSRQYILDRIGEFDEAGISEIIFGGIPSGDLERLQQFEEQIVSSAGNAA